MCVTSTSAPPPAARPVAWWARWPGPAPPGSLSGSALCSLACLGFFHPLLSFSISFARSPLFPLISSSPSPFSSRLPSLLRPIPLLSYFLIHDLPSPSLSPSPSFSPSFLTHPLLSPPLSHPSPILIPHSIFLFPLPFPLSRPSPSLSLETDYISQKHLVLVRSNFSRVPSYLVWAAHALGFG